MWYKIVDPSIILSADSTLLIKAKGCVWHKSSIANGVVPDSGIDTEMQCGRDLVIQRVGYLDTNYIWYQVLLILLLLLYIWQQIFYNCK